MRRTHARGSLGLGVVAVGLAIVALTIRPGFDPVVVALTRNHGLHLTDLVGSAVCFGGAWLIWTRR